MVQATGKKGNIAWCVSPIMCGVTTVYNVVSAGLRRAGWEVLGVKAGVEAARQFDPRFVDEHFQVLLPDSSDLRRNAAEFIRWVEEREIDVVFCTGEELTLAAAPALPSRVRLINRCASMTRYTYGVAAANLNRVDKIIAETPRQQRDLIRDWKVPPEKCVIIPGGVETATFNTGTSRDFSGLLRLVYLGRVDDVSKAVMLLPQIARQLAAAGVEFHFDIIGDGPDRDRLEDAFAQFHLHARVTFHGTLRPQESLPFLQQAHLFLLPSRYEGVPWALLETMACGCVPIASRIAGTTDFVVDHGMNGLLCTVGKASEFTQAVRNLAADRKRLEALSAAAVRTIHDRFTLERVVRDHDTLLQSLLALEPPAYTPIPVTAIQAPNLSGPRWRRFVPQGVKNYVRTWAERFNRSV
jgi:glycosyltransferase involved in cell wall biosynthesis